MKRGNRRGVNELDAQIRCGDFEGCIGETEAKFVEDRNVACGGVVVVYQVFLDKCFSPG